MKRKHMMVKVCATGKSHSQRALVSARGSGAGIHARKDVRSSSSRTGVVLSLVAAATVGGLVREPAEFMGIGAGGVALGAERTWDGGGTGTNWSTANNWNPDTAPVNTDSIVFAGTTDLTNTDNIASLTLTGVTFSATGFTVNANSATVTLSGSFTNSTGTNVWNVPLALSATGYTVTNNGTALTLGGTIANAGNALTVTGAGATTISGVISGMGGLSKDGAGTLTLSGTNTYTGATTINGGILSVGTLANGGTASGIGQSTNAAANLVLGGGTLQYTGGDASTNRAFTITAGTTGTFDVTTAATDLTISGAAANTSGALTKTGAGTLILSGANGYTGATTINGGILSVGTLANGGAASGIGQSTNAAANLVLGGGTLRYTGGTVGIDRAFTITAGTTGTFDVVTAGTNLTISGAAASTSGALTKIGAGTLTLSGTNTYTGAATISGGILSVGTLADGGVASGIGQSTNAAANLVLGGGTLQYTGGTVSTNRAFTITAGTTGTFDVTTAATDLTISGAAANTSGALTKTGAGTLILSGANGYTGATTINGGVLSVGTLANGGATSGIGQSSNGAANLVLGGGTLRYTGGTVSIDRAFTITAGTTGTFDVVNAGTDLTISGAAANTSGALTKTGAGTLTLSGANTYTGQTSIVDGSIQLTTGANRLPAAATVVLGGASTSGKLILGTGATAANQTLTSLTTTGNGGSVVGGNSGIASVLTLNVAGNNTFAGTLGGGGTNESNLALTKIGAGTLVLTGDNTYTGATSVSVGVLNIQNDTALGTTAGGVTVTDGAALWMQSGITVGNEALSLNGTGVTNTGALRNMTGNNTWQGTVTLAGDTRINSETGSLTFNTATNSITGGGSNRNLTLGGAGDGTVSGTITTGSGTLTKDGTGTWTLGGANTYTGATSISAGVLNIQNATALGTTAGGVTVASNAALQIQGGITVGSEALSLNGTGISTDGALRNVGGNNTWQGTVTLAGTTRINSDAGSLSFNTVANSITGTNRNLTLGGAGDGTVSGTITTGSGTLTKDGTGTWTLGGANTYTGATNINVGVLNIQNATALGTIAGGVTVASNAALQIQGGITVGAEALTLNGAGVANDGALRNISGNNTWQGAITLNAATRINSDAGTLTIDVGSGNAIAGTAQNITFGGAGNITVSDPIATTTGSLTKDGAGTLTLGGTNTYAGKTAINQGTLSVAAAANLGANPGSLTADQITINGGTLATTTGINGFGNRGFTLGANGGTIDVSSGQTTAVTTAVAGTGGLTKAGTGILTLSGNNTYSGDTTISAGTLRTSSSGALPSGSGKGNVSVAGGAVLDLNGQSATVNGLSGSGTIRNDGNAGVPANDTTSPATITVGSNNSSSTFAGTIQNGSYVTAGTTDYMTGMGVVNLTKSGTGIQTLTGANSYTGTTTINGGAIDVSGTSGTIGNYGPISITGANSRLIISRTTDYSVASVVSGDGQLVKQGSATLTLGNTNTLSGGISVQGGTVVAGIPGSLGTSAITLNSGTTIALRGSPAIAGFGNGSNWTFNGQANGVNTTAARAQVLDGGNMLAVTTQYDGASGSTGSQATSTYLNAKVDVTSGFVASYVYMTRGGNGTGGRADGVALVFQNDTRGLAALSSWGSGNGYAQVDHGVTPITNSAALVLDTHTLSQTDYVTGGAERSTNNGGGRHWGNGASATDPLAFDDTVTPVSGLGGSGSVNLTGLQPIRVTWVYSPTLHTLSETLTNLTTGDVYSRTYTGVDVAAAVGASTAYLGFTGATGSLTSWQTVSDFTLTQGLSAGDYSANTFTLPAGQTATVRAETNALTLGSFSMGSGSGVNVTAIAAMGPNAVSNIPYQVTANGASLTGTDTFNVANNGTATGTLRLNNVTGTGDLNKQGPGMLQLGGTNTYGGVTTAGAGTIQAMSTNALGNTTRLDTVSGSLVQLNGYGVAVGGLTGAGIVEDASSTSATLTVGNGVADGASFTGTLRDGTGGGKLSLLKQGTDTLTLSGANTYTGRTTINGGTLAYGAHDVLSNQTDVVIGAAGTLNMFGYTDTVASLSVTSGGTTAFTVDPSNPAAHLTTTGNASVGGDSIVINNPGAAFTLGKYTLIKSTGNLSGTATAGTIPTGYRVNTITGAGGEVDLQHLATIGTINASTGSIITDGSLQFTVTVGNSAPSGSDNLNFTLASGTNTTGSNSTPVTVAPGATSGATSGLTFNGTTVGEGRTGTFTVSDPLATNNSQTGMVTVNVYDHASASLSGGTINLGNVHTGYAGFPDATTVTATNATGYRVPLSGSAPAAADGVSLNGISGVAPGGSATIGATVPTGWSAGAISDVFTYTFADNSSLSGARSNVGTAQITVTGGVYNYAAGTVTPTPINLGNVRVNSPFGSQSLTVQNTGPSGSYTEKLDASFGALTGTATTNSGFVSLLNPQASNGTSMQVGLSTPGTAGAKTGTAVVGLTSNGTGTSGLGNTALTPQTITINGSAYDYANPTALSTLNLGTVRPGTTVSKTVAVGNAAVTDASYQDLLDASVTPTNGKLSGTGFAALAASSGGTSTSNLTVNANTSSAGSLADTIAVGYTSNANGVAGLSNKILTAGQLITTGGVYDYAQLKNTPSDVNVNYGNYHLSSSNTTLTSSVAFVNKAAANPAYTDNLVVNSSNATGNLSGGTQQTLGASGSDVSGGFDYSLDISQAGVRSGSLQVNYLSSPTVALDTKQLATQHINASAMVYTGQSTWTGTGTTGSWGGDPHNSTTHENWSASDGAPGVWGPSFDNVDTATFGSATGTNPATITVDSAVSVKGITFANSSGSYTVAPGAGSLGLKSDTGTASLNDSAGSHTITAPITMQSNVSSTVASGSVLTVTQLLTGTGGTQTLTKTGGGTLYFTGTGTSSSNAAMTTVYQGTLRVDGTLNSPTLVTKDSGGAGTLTGVNGTIGGRVELANGGTISPGNGGVTRSSTLTVQSLLLDSGGNYHFDISAMTEPTLANKGYQPSAGANYDTITSAGLLDLRGITAVGGDLNLQVDYPSTGGFTYTKDYHWELGTFAQSIALPTGVTDVNSLFTIDLHLFSAYSHGFWSVSYGNQGSSDHALYLNYVYNSVPEAGTAVFGVIALVPILSHRRRRKPEETSPVD